MSHPPSWIPEAERQSGNLVYYTGDDLRFVWGNALFDRFAAENGAEGMGEALRGRVLTDGFSGSHRCRWQAIYAKILSGTLASYCERFACPSPRVRRELFMQVEPVWHEGKRYLRHETIPISEKPGRSGEKTSVRTQDGRSDGIEFSGFLRSLKPESGDAYWTRALEDGRTALLVADAMGSGPAAARATECLLDVLASLPLVDLQQAVTTANREFMNRMGGIPGETPFVTGILMTVDPPTARLDVVCFGHHGLIFTPGGPVEVSGGLPIGVLEDNEEWAPARLELGTLGLRGLAYTDGIVEQFDSSGMMYGTQSLEQNFHLTARLPLSQTLSALVLSLDDWRGDAMIKDDQTLLGFELLS